MPPSKPNFSLPVVAAEDYRHAVPGEMWELRPVSIAGPIEFRSSPRNDSPEAITRLAEISLQTPVDFPSISDAILAGDHIAFAVDPNVPRLAEILEGAIKVARDCEAGRVSIVLWPEASDACCQSLTQRFQNVEGDGSEPGVVMEVTQSGEMPITVSRHAARDRRVMRYVAADADAEAVYLARDLVDADFTIPIVAARAVDAVERLDKTGVFPMFADSSTVHRFQNTTSRKTSEGTANEIGWLLGVQLLMMVSADAAGSVARILTGTPDAIRGELDTLHTEEESDTNVSETRPRSELVIAALDGDANVQTWSNVARAAIAASQHIEGDGTIVIWSRLTERPGSDWMRELSHGADRVTTVDDDDDSADKLSTALADQYKDDFSDEADQTEDGDHEDDPDTAMTEDKPAPVGDYADWSMDRVLAKKLSGLLESYRVLLHSELADSDVEALGMGVIASVEELRRLGAGFQGAGVLRAAQFHDGCVSRFDIPTE
ncbi:transcriptional regulator [Aporhodopirellula aestuarii]|uniref:Transcriptional regulator n=1 Tax=Aporhodopirellula aestuarii TaxID=2950107 RepID=A0ABT0U2L8_9BACT|nr:transcriptional regulator [Aporhodopirellula aestuarii]MCM2371043.1 transcriptional regulator [Aporhodopirellula aestuarii]